MNNEDLENHLRKLPPPRLPESWRAEILAAARSEVSPARPARAIWPPVFLYLNQIFAQNPLTTAALAMLWLLTLILRTTTPVDPAAEKMLIAHRDLPPRFELLALSEQIRLAEYLQDPPEQREQIP